MHRLLSARQGNTDALDQYLRDIAAIPKPTEDAIEELGLRAAAGNLDARESLVRGHLDLVVRIARLYRQYGLPLADLIAEGNVALLRAAELYDPKFGTRFSSYASLWIRQRIHRALTSQSRPVRLPVWRSQRLRRLARHHENLTARFGREPTTEELAARMGMPLEEFERISEERIEVHSLDATPEAVDCLPPDAAPDPAHAMDRREMRDKLIALMAGLDDRELKVVTLKFGLHGGPALSFRKMSAHFGVSREWLRRIAELALVKVRREWESASVPGKDRDTLKRETLARIRHFALSPIASAR